jgi:hypothetical protein
MLRTQIAVITELPKYNTRCKLLYGTLGDFGARDAAPNRVLFEPPVMDKGRKVVEAN